MQPTAFAAGDTFPVGLPKSALRETPGLVHGPEHHGGFRSEKVAPTCHTEDPLDGLYQ
jgi:hypothetical protein